VGLCVILTIFWGDRCIPRIELNLTKRPFRNAIICKKKKKKRNKVNKFVKLQNVFVRAKLSCYFINLLLLYLACYKNT